MARQSMTLIRENCMIPAGLADRGEICGAINQGLIYAGVPLNPDPPKNDVNYAEEIEV
jgi:hypothetical protein